MLEKSHEAGGCNTEMHKLVDIGAKVATCDECNGLRLDDTEVKLRYLPGSGSEPTVDVRTQHSPHLVTYVLRVRLLLLAYNVPIKLNDPSYLRRFIGIRFGSYFPSRRDYSTMCAALEAGVRRALAEDPHQPGPLPPSRAARLCEALGALCRPDDTCKGKLHDALCALCAPRAPEMDGPEGAESAESAAAAASDLFEAALSEAIESGELMSHAANSARCAAPHIYPKSVQAERFMASDRAARAFRDLVIHCYKRDCRSGWKAPTAESDKMVQRLLEKSHMERAAARETNPSPADVVSKQAQASLEQRVATLWHSLYERCPGNAPQLDQQFGQNDAAIAALHAARSESDAQPQDTSAEPTTQPTSVEGPPCLCEQHAAARLSVFKRSVQDSDRKLYGCVPVGQGAWKSLLSKIDPDIVFVEKTRYDNGAKQANNVAREWHVRPPAPQAPQAPHAPQARLSAGSQQARPPPAGQSRKRPADRDDDAERPAQQARVAQGHGQTERELQRLQQQAVRSFAPR
jgi:hypothetical protein